jgi:hypothetical protein
MQGLMGAQANDSGWPTLSGKYVEYPRFRKVWWAYRQTYHGHVRDELVCRSLKEKSLASGVKMLVNDIDDLREAWNTLDTCFDRPEKYIAEALDPVVKFRSYKAFDNGTIREFYSLLRATMMGARKAGLLHRLVNDHVTQHLGQYASLRLAPVGKGAANLDEEGHRGGVLELCGPKMERRLKRGSGRAANLGHRKWKGCPAGGREERRDGRGQEVGQGFSTRDRP